MMKRKYSKPLGEDRVLPETTSLIAQKTSFAGAGERSGPRIAATDLSEVAEEEISTSNLRSSRRRSNATRSSDRGESVIFSYREN